MKNEKVARKYHNFTDVYQKLQSDDYKFVWFMPATHPCPENK